MQDRIGEEFAGSVSSVTSFGIFVALDDVFVEGLVHISELGSDYFHYDSAKHQLVGERTGRRFRLSDRVRVQLVRVDMESSKIDFRLIEEAGSEGRAPWLIPASSTAFMPSMPACGRAPAACRKSISPPDGRTAARATSSNWPRRRACASSPPTRRGSTAWPAAMARRPATRAWWRACRRPAPRHAGRRARHAGRAGPPAGARRRAGSAQPRRLPARGRCRRGACGGCAEGPGSGAQRHGHQGGLRRRRHRALCHRHQPGAGAARDAGARHPDRRRRRRGRQGHLRRRPQAPLAWCWVPKAAACAA
jgi:ribonuclease R